jgi:predicted alpha/beta-hydrolase family hydrolase
MADIKITSLPISGYGGGTVPNRFFQQAGTARALAVVLPGLNYTCDMPLLYYPARLLVEHGADVLQVHVDYTLPAFQSKERAEQAAWLGLDAQAAVQAGMKPRKYERLILIGKSIGTLSLAYLVAQGGYATATTIWLTPLLRQPLLVQAASQCQGPALFVAGTGDTTYEPAVLAKILEATGAKSFILEEANHSLEIPGDLRRSVAWMSEYIHEIERFLNF